MSGGEIAAILVCIAGNQYTHLMRTNIELDDRLVAEAMRATGQTTKRATVEEALRTVVRLARQRDAIAELSGLGWEGDLDEMRIDRPVRGARRR